jgi:hypothetical protein
LQNGSLLLCPRRTLSGKPTDYVALVFWRYKGRHLETFLSRQVRRHTDAEKWTFTVTEQKGGRSRQVNKELRFTPRLELHAEVGRRLNLTGAGEAELTHMVFTNRQSHQSIGKGHEVKHKEVMAHVDIKISAKQGPEDPEEKKGWIQELRTYFTGQGFEARLYYRHANGRVTGGEVHHALDSAADLLMCPTAFISLDAPPRPWEATVNADVAVAMRELLDQDDLWGRSK